MSWVDRVVDAVQTAAVIGERVERLSDSVAEMAVEMRNLDRRVARLEGATAATAKAGSSSQPRRLPPPEDEG